VVTQVVAPGIVTAAGRDLAMTDLFHGSGSAEKRAEHTTGSTRARSASVAEVALGLASLVSRAALPQHGPLTPVQVRVVQDEAGLRLQVQDVGERGVGWQELVDDADGAVQVVLADEREAGSVGPDRPRCASSPFTAREQQVAALLSRGMSDRAIAEALLISRKTAEKHVGAVLRKTGTTSRTAAVVRAMERGWHSEGLATGR
jgi:DNA-binding NarL/FixJ family response regulator